MWSRVDLAQAPLELSPSSSMSNPPLPTRAIVLPCQDRLALIICLLPVLEGGSRLWDLVVDATFVGFRA